MLVNQVDYDVKGVHELLVLHVFGDNFVGKEVHSKLQTLQSRLITDIGSEG